MVGGRIAVSLGGGDENESLQRLYFEKIGHRPNEVGFYQNAEDIVDIMGERPFDIVAVGYTQLRGKYNDVASLAEAVRADSPQVFVVACLPADSDLIKREEGSKWIDGAYHYDMERLPDSPESPEVYGNLVDFLLSSDSVELARRSRKNDDFFSKIEGAFPFIKTFYDRS